MATPSKSTPITSSDTFEQKGNGMTESNAAILQCPLNQQLHSSLDGPVAILWDIENCPVPSDVRPEDVAGNIRMALRVHPVIKGAVMLFSAYGDFNSFPKKLREGCQRTGVKLIDVPNGRKDAADKAILVDLFLFALDNPPPSSIMLISGDVDFAPALHILGQRGYTVILVIPAGVCVSSALCNAGKFVWDWPCVSRGEGFVLPSNALVPPRGGPIELAGLMGCHVNDNSEGLNEEEAIVYRVAARLVSMDDFLRHRPSKFTGKATPDEAEAWIGEGEKIAAVIGCTREQQLAYTTFLLVGDANHWWNDMMQQMRLGGEEVSWENFRTRFLEKYFPASARQDREAEFLTLQQGSMSVQDYVNKFEYLARFDPREATDEWRCRKFERGLRHDLMKVVIPMEIREFPELVEKAKMVEQLEAGPPRVIKTQKSDVAGKFQKKPYARPQSSTSKLQCYQCGGPHYKRACPNLVGTTGGDCEVKKCFICDKPGHFAKRCPEKRTSTGFGQQKFGE